MDCSSDGSPVTVQLRMETEGKKEGSSPHVPMLTLRVPLFPSSTVTLALQLDGDSTFSEVPLLVNSGLDPQLPLTSPAADRIPSYVPRRTSNFHISPSIGN